MRQESPRKTWPGSWKKCASGWKSYWGMARLADAPASRTASGSACCHGGEQITGVTNVHQQQQGTIYPCYQLAPAGQAEAHHQQGQCQPEHQGPVAVEYFRGDRQRLNNRGKAHHGQGVENPGTQNVAKDQVVLVLLYRGQCRCQFRQGGTDRDDGQPDNQVADAQALGDGYRAPDQNPGADNQQNQPDHQPDDGAFQGHGESDHLGFGVPGQRIFLALITLVDRPAHTGGKDNQQHAAIKLQHFCVQQLCTGNQGQHQQQWQLLADNLGMHGNGRDDGGQADNQCNVGNVRTVAVPQGQSRVAI